MDDDAETYRLWRVRKTVMQVSFVITETGRGHPIPKSHAVSCNHFISNGNLMKMKIKNILDIHVSDDIPMSTFD